MKKLFILFTIVLSLALVGNVGAFGGGGFGWLDVEASAVDGAIDFDKTHVPDGGAFGISGAGGLAGAEADGFILNGTVEGEVSAVGGGLTDTDAFRGLERIPYGMKLHVGSTSTAQAVTGASVRVKVDPEGRLIFGFIPTAFGEADGRIFGIAGQATLNASYLGDGPVLRTDGSTSGIAGQGSIGGFAGGAWAVSGPDYKVKVGYTWRKWVCRGTGERCERTGHWIYKEAGLHFNPHPRSGWERVGPIWREVDSKAGAGAGANITMNGFSYSESFRLFTEKDGVRTEAMGTFVGAGTEIISSGYNYDWDKGLGCSDSYLYGGWKAAGGAYSQTQIGGATATAVGVYAGSGGLNQNYNGSAVGYTNGSVTTVNGMKGSIVAANAEMSVTSNVTRNQPQPQ